MDTTNTVTVQDAMAVLDKGVADMISSEGWVEYLRTQAKFHQYSMHNCLWLMMQAMARGVDVSRFAGFQTWKSLDRHVRKGEKSFKVLAPCSYKREVELADGTTEEVRGIRGFRVVSVFDVSQTDGAPLATLVKELDSSSEAAKGSYDKLVAWLTSKGVTVARESLSGGVYGYYSRTAARIVVDASLSDVQALKTLCHEVGHFLLHSTDDDASRETAEVEAESSAFVILSALGYDTGDYSFGYIAKWSKGSKEIVRGVATRVQKTARTVLEVLS